MTMTILYLMMNCASAQEPTLDNVQEWAHNIKDQLFSRGASSDNQIENLLKMSYRQHIREFVKLDGIELVRSMAARLSKTFQKKVAALRRVKSRAESSITEYQYDATLGKENVGYFDMKNGSEVGPIKPLEFEYDSRYSRNVSHHMSGVHIPIEIWEGDRRILNGLLWSSQLDPVFQENAENDSKLAWQFFGSQDGFLRVYPANNWLFPASSQMSLNPSPDLYDVRRRPWYIQSIASPKDVLILMDISGSVHGQTLGILKSSVQAVLDTLEENDYVHVASFSNETKPVSCSSFIQANSHNKKALSAALENLRASGVTNYAAALEYAFDRFNYFSDSKRPYEGSECNRAIMFFTDGGTDRADSVLAERNPNASIRIFTYSVAPHATPTHVLREMACKGRGYFHAVTAKEAVRSAAQRYPGILARTMALENGENPTYSAAYTDAGGLGLVVSVTLPVYNRTDGSKNQTTVGILGTDVPMRDLSDLMPVHLTGPNAYSFIINGNGFVVLHPKMVAKESYDEDAPDMDMLDVELDDPSQEPYLALLRKDMIDGKTGSKQYHTFINAGDSNHICQKNVTYYYAPIDDTPFSLALVIPDDRHGYINKSNGEEVRKLNTLDLDLAKTNGAGLLIAPWEFCNGLQPLGDILALETRLQNSSGENCSESLLGQLIFDIECSRAVNSFQRAKFKLQEHRTSIFVGMEGGLLRIFPPDQAVHFQNVKDPLKATYFRKALHYSAWAFFVSGEIDSKEATVTAVKAIEINNQYKPAIYGIQFRESALFYILRNFSECDDPEKLACYLVDDGGYIIISNNKHHVDLSGQFLGEEDATLMSHLVNHSLYKRHLEYDYHATCTRNKKGVTAAASNGPVSLIRFLAHALLDAAAWLTVWPFSGSSANIDILTPLSNPNIRYKNETCTTFRALYYFSPVQNEMGGSGSVQGEMACGNCTRKFMVAHVPSSNLLLVVATPRDHCIVSESCVEPQLQHLPEEETTSPDVCDLEPRYRRRPLTCYNYHPLEDTSECGSAGRVRIAMFTIFISFLVAWSMQLC